MEVILWVGSVGVVGDGGGSSGGMSQHNSQRTSTTSGLQRAEAAMQGGCVLCFGYRLKVNVHRGGLSLVDVQKR